MTDGGQKNKSGIVGIGEDLKKYVEKRLELLVITIAEQVSLILADSIQRILGMLLLAGGLFFLWFAAGFYVGELVESYALGFLIVSIPPIVAGILFLKFKPDSVTRSIQAEIVKNFLQSVDETTPLSLMDDTKKSTEDETG